jgi:hypothetical protein
MLLVVAVREKQYEFVSAGGKVITAKFFELGGMPGFELRAAVLVKSGSAPESPTPQ